MKPILLAVLSIFFLLTFSGCSPQAAEIPAVASPPAPTPIPTATVTATSPPPTLAPSLTPSLIPTPLPQVCSPLPGYNLADLPGMVSNPYSPPPPGSDDPHHGADLSVRLPGSQVAVAGHLVAVAYPGQVVAVVRDRFPYGNTVIVETSLEAYPNAWWEPVGFPTPAPAQPPRTALTCPAGLGPEIPSSGARSLYILYAHLQQMENLSAGDAVTCGQVIGTIGDTGNALNPHLHFEARVGPSGLRLDSMAHYDASASLAEMSSYCLWRISGLFQLVDPLLLLRTDP
jgi:murein DD-endopeptidase MepM/ murein hydrolase activator NlpD